MKILRFALLAASFPVLSQTPLNDIFTCSVDEQVALVCMSAQAPPQQVEFPWTEAATWVSRDGLLKIGWASPGGDWSDSAGVRNGTSGYDEVVNAADGVSNELIFDVMPILAGHPGSDIALVGATGIVRVHSRESATTAKHPVLEIDGVPYPVTEDVHLDPSTNQSLGTADTMMLRDGRPAYFRADGAPSPTTSAFLKVWTATEYTTHTIKAMRPVTDQLILPRPTWLAENDTELTALTASNTDTKEYNVNVLDSALDTLSVTMPDPQLTWLAHFDGVPVSDVSCMTVYQKIGADFVPPNNGKWPGLANTGNLRNPSGAFPDTVDGVAYPNSGWGGRASDGLHWAARMGFGGHTPTHVSANAFYMSLDVGIFEASVPWTYPVPREEWHAYTTCLKLNGPTLSDGALYTELHGRGGVLSIEGIQWRSIDHDFAKISEAWVNYYCGGTSCGTGSRGTIHFGGMRVTAGFPNSTAIGARLNQLNAQ